MRLLIAFILYLKLGVVALFLLVNGIQEFMIVQRNPAPVEMSLYAYLQSPPDAEWVRLTSCQVEYPLSVCFHDKARRSLSEISAPVYPDAGRSQPVRVILVKKGSLADNTFRNGMVEVNHPIQGLIRSGFKLDSKLWPYARLNPKLLDAAQFKLDDQYIVIDEGAEPSFKMAFLKLAGALGLGALSTWGITRILNRFGGRANIGVSAPAQPSAAI